MVSSLIKEIILTPVLPTPITDILDGCDRVSVWIFSDSEILDILLFHKRLSYSGASFLGFGCSCNCGPTREKVIFLRTQGQKIHCGNNFGKIKGPLSIMIIVYEILIFELACTLWSFSQVKAVFRDNNKALGKGLMRGTGL
jgi:hypothetical protein